MHKTLDPFSWSVFFRHHPTEHVLKVDCSGQPIDEIRFDGDTSALMGNRPRVLIVGTRDISPYGKAKTRRIVEALSKNPARPVVISGLALGVDTEAHLAALDNGMPTVAVLPTGLDTVYPQVNRELAKRITQTPGCCLMTQFPDETAPMAINFFSRNAVMATMADLVIVVESKPRGGAIVTARYAYDQGIPVLAIPGRVDDVRSQGCNALISTGIATMLSSIANLETINLSQDA